MWHIFWFTKLHLGLRPGGGYELDLVVHELDVGPEAEDLEDGVGAVVGRLAGEEVVGDAHRRVRQPQQHAPRRLVEDGRGLQTVDQIWITYRGNRMARTLGPIDCSGYGLTGYGGYKSATGYKILTGYVTG